MDEQIKRVLVVEDDEDIQQMISLYLHDSGYKIDFVGDGKAMYAYFKSGKKPDLVLLDLGLPDIDGLQLTEQIRAFSPVPIFILTARSDQKDKVSALSLGADDYLTKPFDPEELRLRINNLMLRPCEPEVVSEAVEKVNAPRLNSFFIAGIFVGVVLLVGFGFNSFFNDQPQVQPQVQPQAQTQVQPNDQPEIMTTNQNGVDTISMDVAARCEGSEAIFTVTNTGERWPSPAEVRIYRVSSQTTILKRKVLMALNQRVTFKVSSDDQVNYASRVTGSEGFGLWIKPGWYTRPFNYDSTINCQ